VLSRAINKAGCDVREYFHWGLTDNFEWEEIGEKNCFLFYLIRSVLCYRGLI
jgi:beta-glucosidase/6-phospho-beta-glucosidase/beta-galactosidase